MVPSSVPPQLTDLTQCEEMLIARAFPIMHVYTKSVCGYLGYRGHIINLPNNVQHISDVLPQCPGDIPIVAFIMKGKNDFVGEFRVRRRKVLQALLWLVGNNPVYRNVTIDESRLENLPDDGNLNIDVVMLDNVDLTTADTGPPIDKSDNEVKESFEVPFHVDNGNSDFEEKELSSLLSASISQVPKENEIIEKAFGVGMNPEMKIGDEPINEFCTQYLATLAFPCLFPDGLGDPTNNGVPRQISDKENDSFAKKLKHLIRFGEYINGKWQYRFAAHPRFGYWAYNMLYRKRILGQGNFYIKQNPGHRILDIVALREILRSGTQHQVANISHYVTPASIIFKGTNVAFINFLGINFRLISLFGS